MKKLKKINLNKSFEDFTPLKEWELRTIVAGDGDPSWDCLFNAFIYTYEELYGITLNKLANRKSNLLYGRACWLYINYFI